MGETLSITGGQPLYGTVEVPAAKNSVLPLLAASLLCGGPVRLRAVPPLSDVACCMEILRSLGYATAWAGGDVSIQPAALRTSVLPFESVSKMRASVLFLAPLLARTGRAETGLPGGCRIGLRPIDIHLEGLCRMGAEMLSDGETENRLVLCAPHGLHGADFTLRFPSVGATETLLMAAAAAKGTSVLRGAACEPEIVDLAKFLCSCGADIRGAGESVITVRGRQALSGAAFVPLPDRIYASTLACAVAAAGGEIRLRRCDAFALAPLLALLRQAGCVVRLSGKNEVTVARLGRLYGVGRVFTGVYPGFATDAAPLLAAALLQAESPSSIYDVIFENRFACAAQFRKMGAAVQGEKNLILLAGGSRLHGAEVSAPDLRGGAALAVAALAAQGKTRIVAAEHIRRGYADLGKVLEKLGGNVKSERTKEKRCQPF